MHDNDEMYEGSERRFALELFIVHPTIEPLIIERALGLMGTHVHRVGDQRTTAIGKMMPGKYPDTRWRYSKRYTVSDEWFVYELDEFLSQIEICKQFLWSLRDSGGKVYLNINFLGDGYFGDVISTSTLKKILDLGLDLGLAVYVVPQN
ncbi:MAG: hypothetical protein AAGB04_15915 [Pseudomonadota bacterium]